VIQDVQMPKLPEKHKGRDAEGKDKVPVLRLPRHGKGARENGCKGKSEMKRQLLKKKIWRVILYARKRK